MRLFVFKTTSLQLHKQQHEDRPDSYGHGKLHHHGIPHRTPSGQGKRQQHHGKSSQYSNKELSFGIHSVDLAFPLSSRNSSSLQIAGDCTPVFTQTVPARMWGRHLDGFLREVKIRPAPQALTPATMRFPDGGSPESHRQAELSLRSLRPPSIPNAASDAVAPAGNAARSGPRRRLW